MYCPSHYSGIEPHSIIIEFEMGRWGYSFPDIQYTHVVRRLYIQRSAWTTFLLELEVPQFWDDVSHRFLMPPTAFKALDLNRDTW